MDFIIFIIKIYPFWYTASILECNDFLVKNGSFNRLAANNNVEARAFWLQEAGGGGRQCDSCRKYSMMQKVHSGVVVQSKGERFG